MSFIIRQHTSDVISLQEFIDVCDRACPFDSVARYSSLFEPLVSLTNNRAFLTNFIIDSLKNIEDYQKDNPHNIQSLILAERGEYTIRANFWPPVGESENREKSLEYFSYNFPHDHNFHFLTVGYIGTGYQTDIYTYDNERVSGKVGESVDIEWLGKFSLSRNDLMIYEASKHIHTQYPPKEFSVSINVIPKQSSIRSQYAFDIFSHDRAKIKNIIDFGSPLNFLEDFNQLLDEENLDKQYCSYRKHFKLAKQRELN